VHPRILAGIGAAAIAFFLLLSPTTGTAQEFSVPARPPVASRDPRFGIVQSIQSPDLAVAAGATWERIIFPWADMEPERGKMERAQFSDAEIRAQVARGFTEVGVIIYTPVWAAPNPQKAPRNVVPRNLHKDWKDPDNYWAQFTGRLAARYKGMVDHWIIWNEPDLYGSLGGLFFDGSIEDYYQLLKVAYLSIKENNPNATVLVAGMAYWFDQWYHRNLYLSSLLDVAAGDPSARGNNWYFDAAVAHTYAHPLYSYANPVLMKRAMQARGIDKPIWIAESNAVPGDDPRTPTQAGAYRASQDEQASYVIQSYAMSIAAGVERHSIYKMIDEKDEEGRLYGLVRNDGSVRPAYVAYQVAATHFSDVRWASYSWSGSNTPPAEEEIDALLASNQNRAYWIWPGQVNRVVMERGDLRTTVVWNATPRPVRAEVQAAASHALGITQYGNSGQVVARNGVYTLDLEPTQHNVDPTDSSIYLIGGRPWILEEAVAPLPDRVRTRLQSVWPHESAPIEQAEVANVTALVLNPDESAPVPCRWEPRVLLWSSFDSGPREFMGQGTKEMVRTDSAEFPVWRFYNVAVGRARTGGPISFSVTVDGITAEAATWTYGGPEPTPIEPTYFPRTSCR
jgi:hypothetical protein